jgi:hypothetical protein
MVIIADMCHAEFFVGSQQSPNLAQPMLWLPPTGEVSPCNRQEESIYRAIASPHDGHGASASSLTQSSCTSTEETINKPAYCSLAPSSPGVSLVPNFSSDAIPASIVEGNLKPPEGLQNASDDARKKFECPICGKILLNMHETSVYNVWTSQCGASAAFIELNISTETHVDSY